MAGNFQQTTQWGFKPDGTPWASAEEANQFFAAQRAKAGFAPSAIPNTVPAATPPPAPAPTTTPRATQPAPVGPNLSAETTADKVNGLIAKKGEFGVKQPSLGLGTTPAPKQPQVDLGADTSLAGTAAAVKKPIDAAAAKAPPTAVLPVAKPVVSNTGTVVPLSGVSTKTTEQTNRPEQIDYATQATAAKLSGQKAEQEVLSGLPKQMEDLQAKFGTNKAAQVKDYMDQLDRNDRAAFWSKITEALGQVTAGAVGKWGGTKQLDVGSKYNVKDSYDRQGQDQLAKAKYDIQIAQTDEDLKNAIANLQAVTANKAKESSMEFNAKSDLATNLGKIPSGTTETTTGTDQKFFPNPARSETKGKTGGLRMIPGIGYPREKAEVVFDAAKKAWDSRGTEGIPPSGDTLEAQAISFGELNTPPGLDKQNAVNVYKFVASEPENKGLTPDKLATKAITDIHKATTLPPIAYDTYGRNWYDRYVTAFRKAGIDFGHYPSEVGEIDVDGVGKVRLNPNDPYDPNNRFLPGYEPPAAPTPTPAPTAAPVIDRRTEGYPNIKVPPNYDPRVGMQRNTPSPVSGWDRPSDSDVIERLRRKEAAKKKID